MVYVRKKDGTRRLCVDYRHLNEVTHKDKLPTATDPAVFGQSIKCEVVLHLGLPVWVLAN